MQAPATPPRSDSSLTTPVSASRTLAYATLPRQFVDWWPVTARVILNSLYSTTEERQKAVRALEPLTFTSHLLVEELGQLKTTNQNPQIQELYTQYNLRLNSEVYHIHAVKRRWLQAIKTCCAQCQDVVQTHNRVLNKLCQVRDKLAAEASQPIVLGHAVSKAIQCELREKVVEFCNQTAAQIAGKSQLDLKAIRLDCTNVAYVLPPDAHDSTERIEQLESTLVRTNTDDAGAIKDITDEYHMRVQWQEWKAVKEIQASCLQTWIAGLEETTVRVSKNNTVPGYPVARPYSEGV